MSVHITSMIWRARLGNAVRKGVAMKLGDCADDRGGNCYPSIERIAREAEVSARTVQRAMREFERVGLLVLQRAGGKGPRSTNSYAFDIGLLRRLADNEIEMTGSGTSVAIGPYVVPEIKGDTVTPLAVEKGDRASPIDVKKGDSVTPLDELRVTLTTKKGDTQSPNPSGTGQGVGRECLEDSQVQNNNSLSHPLPLSLAAGATLGTAPGNDWSRWRPKRTLDALRAEGQHLDEVEHFVAPLAERLAPPPSVADALALLADLRDQAARHRATPKALRCAAIKIRQSRAKLPPLVAEIDPFIAAAVIESRVEVRPGDPRWEAWLAHWTRHPDRMTISDPGIFRRRRQPFSVDADWPPASADVAEAGGRFLIPWGTPEHAAHLAAWRRAGRAELAQSADVAKRSLNEATRWPVLDAPRGAR